ncbi:hypothetical protein [Croceibacterium aestuarii]|uniref:hypothetical protein n=1 Tax=Croceibacterium aestuarii TaxID=3064139 RepID=UPI00272E1ECD|nr:hypothetical protein [Croceibacterium sp. D39]
MRSDNVLLPIAMPTQKQLRDAIANIIRDIQRDHGETDQCTADRVGVSIGTVRNARNETADLNALTIAKIGAVYGARYVDPYNALYGATAHPLSTSEVDPLSDMARAVATICDMRRADSPGGSTELPKEKLDALPSLKAAAASLTAYIASIERLRAAA